jgi:hypothetical protein
MSLINDALRRASQTEKDRPRPTSTATGMEPAPVARSSRLTVILAATVLVALLLAGWFFWQWWHVRNSADNTVATANIAPPVAPRVIPPPAVAKPIPVAPSAPIAPVKPAPAPAPVAVVPATPAVAAPPVAAPAGLPNMANFSPTPWPVDLKLGGIFYNKTNAQALINGNIYKIGDEIHGVVIKKIDPDIVTVEWEQRTRTLSMGGH